MFFKFCTEHLVVLCCFFCMMSMSLPPLPMSERVYKTDSRIRTRNGKKYISVTSVFNFVHVRGFLDIWKEELISRFGERYYPEFMEETADQGSVMHGLIEYNLRAFPEQSTIDFEQPLSSFITSEGELLMNPEWIKRFNDRMIFTVWEKYANWTDWKSQANITEVNDLETVVFSDIHRYSGRFDGIMTRENIGVGLHDWKSSSYAASDKHKMQVAAYYFAYLEQTGIALDYAAIVSCGMATKKGWHETILIPASKATKKTSPTQTLEYWYQLYQKHLALAMSALEHVLSDEESLPRFITA